MAIFTYKVKDGDGNTLTGSLESEDRRTAVSSLQRMGYWVLDAREMERTGGNSWSPFSLFVQWFINPIFGGAPIRSVALFYRQFATLITAGMSLSQALNSLGARAPTKRLSAISREAARMVESGGKLSDAFARYPAMFPDLHISLLRAGETGGSIDRMLERIADYSEREYKIRQRMRMATFYPKILVLALIFIPAFPKLILEGFRSYVGATIPILITLLIWIVAILVAYRLLYQIPAVRGSMDMAKLTVPLIGPVVRMLALSRFCRAFASLYSAGTSPSQAISNAARACGNWYINRRLQTAIPMVEKGRSFTEAMNQTRILPQMTIDMLATGEQTGNVGDMGDKVADFTDNEAEVKIHQLTMISGVLLVHGIAAYIGVQVIAFYLKHYGSMLDVK